MVIVTMQVTVLGKSPSWEDAGGACSGYLIEEGDTAVLLDCGNGVFSKLRMHRDYTTVDAVLISHLHADHVLDLVPYAYALTYAPRQQPVPVAEWPGTNDPARPRLLAPPGARRTFHRVAGAFGDDDLLDKAFRVTEYDPTRPLALGDLRASFHEVPHFTTTYAINFTSANGVGRFTYSADCRPSEELVEAARETDLLIVEATLPRPERTGERGHMTPAEAGEHARRAGARRVVLTHISDELDHEWAAEQGRDTFGGPVEVAREGAVYEV
jgi:ribonuclease BN (tRNA processing enzyme)